MKFFLDLPLLQVFFMTIAISFGGMAVAALITEAIQKSQLMKQLSHLRFIKNDKINDLIGVNVTKWLVTKTGWGKANPKLKLEKTAGPDRLREIRFEMSKAEVGHIIAFLLQGLITIGLLLLKADSALVIALAVANILLNIYPILLQQRNKARVDKLLNRLTTAQAQK